MSLSVFTLSQSNLLSEKAQKFIQHLSLDLLEIIFFKNHQGSEGVKIVHAVQLYLPIIQSVSFSKISGIFTFFASLALKLCAVREFLENSRCVG